MATLGAQKQALLNQVKAQADSIQADKLKQLVQLYDDVKVEDFKDIVSSELYNKLLDLMRDPREVALWNEIVSAPHNDVEQIKQAQQKCTEYITRYPSGSKINDVTQRLNALRIELATAIEQRDWEQLERGNYAALQNYRNRYPNSVHLDELDDLMWAQTKVLPRRDNFMRYLGDWPNGRHASDCQRALGEIDEWERLKHSDDDDLLFLVDDYRDNHPDSPFIGEVDALYWKLRDQELCNMRANPSDYSIDDVQRLIQADIFTDWQLIDEGLMTEESWETAQLDRSLLPDIQAYQQEDPNIAVRQGATDIYLFGTPGTGKTCLLMGLAGTNGASNDRGENYTLDLKSQGGDYAAALQEYAESGITPGRTFGSFVTTIYANITEKDRRNRIINHPINLVEMSGEEFALRIAENKEVSLENMGTGVANLLTNDNHKVFFIIVDCTKDKVKFEYTESIRDSEGNIIDERLRKKYLNQNIILAKFIALFSQPGNQKIMEKVDAIHFIVTKADTLSDDIEERMTKARDLLLNKYSAPVQTLKNYCQQTHRINAANRYAPKVFTFSLGKFYLCDVFDFNHSETMHIIEIIRDMTRGERSHTFGDVIRGWLG